MKKVTLELGQMAICSFCKTAQHEGDEIFMPDKPFPVSGTLPCICLECAKASIEVVKDV